jgi:hypothetical protein
LPLDETKIKQIVIRSEYFHDILDKVPSKIITWGNTGILAILILIALSLRVIKYPDVITSNAIITTEKPPVEVYSRTSGRIINFLKKDQERVKKGEWVIILNNSANYKDVIKTREILISIDSSDFWTSIDSVAFDKSVSLGDIQSIFFQFIRCMDELNLFLKLNSQYKQLSINSRRGENLVAIEEKMINQLTSLQKQFELVTLDFERSKKFYDDGFIAKADLEQKEIAYLNIKNRVENAKEGVLNTQLEKESLEKENTNLEVEKNDSYLTLRNNLLQNYNNLLFEISEWENKYVLASPIDGKLNLFEIRSQDQFLSNESKVFTVTSMVNQNYFAIAQLPISNSGKVQIGQSCIIKLQNYPYTEFGMLKGIIQSLSLASKEGFYSVKVSLPNQLITTRQKELPHQSEFIGQAEIIIEDQTLFDRLFNSLIAKNY